MTETATFPFDASTISDDDDAAGPDRRKLLLLIAVGVIASALVGYFVAVQLFGGAEPVTAPVTGARTVPAPLAAASPPAPAAPPRSVTAAANRNPFVPLAFAPVAAAAAGSGSAAAAPRAPLAAAAPAQQPSTSAATPGMTTFKVLSISGNQAVVTIDGSRYTASVGQTFAKTFKLIATSGGVCGDFSNGATRLGLCEGQTLIF